MYNSWMPVLIVIFWMRCKVKNISHILIYIFMRIIYKYIYILSLKDLLNVSWYKQSKGPYGLLLYAHFALIHYRVTKINTNTHKHAVYTYTFERSKLDRYTLEEWNDGQKSFAEPIFNLIFFRWLLHVLYAIV